MNEEINYTCWFEGQDERDGIVLKAPNLEAAARQAVDIWRHKNIKELGGATITVYLKNERDEVSKVYVRGNEGDARMAQI